MKKLAALVLVIFFTLPGTSQDLFEFGLMGGVNLPNLTLDNKSSISDISTDGGFGWHAGVMARINILFLYVQPELLYTNVNSDYSFTEVNSGIKTTGTYNMQRLDIPIPIGFKFGPVALFAGPVASFNLSSPDEIFDNSYKSATWGYQAGAGLKLKGILVEVKYEGPFETHATSATISGNEFNLDARTSMWVASVGYFF